MTRSQRKKDWPRLVTRESKKHGFAYVMFDLREGMFGIRGRLVSKEEYWRKYNQHCDIRLRRTNA